MLPVSFNPDRALKAPMSSEFHGGLYSWSLPILVTLSLMVVALVYSRGWYQLRNVLPNVLPVWRLAAFVGGLFSLWAAVGSPLAILDHQLLTLHMVQHLVLMTVAAPLILLGAPVIPLLHRLPQRFVRPRLCPPLRCPLVHGIVRIVTHPLYSCVA